MILKGKNNTLYQKCFIQKRKVNSLFLKEKIFVLIQDKT